MSARARQPRAEHSSAGLRADHVALGCAHGSAGRTEAHRAGGGRLPPRGARAPAHGAWQAVRGFLDEVPALKQLKLVVRVDLQGRGDVQQFRLQMPEVQVKREIAADARVAVQMRRDFFNLMVEHGAKVADWRDAYEDGRLKVSGVDQYLRLIANVVERQEERNRTRRARR